MLKKNKNRPAKGSLIKVEPIRKWKDIRKLRSLLSRSPRDLALFNIGINTNLRAGDLVNLRVGQVKYLKPGDTLVLKETKTGKYRAITLNKACYHSIQTLLNSNQMKDTTNESFLFQSQKGKNKLLVSSLSEMVKIWAKRANLKGNYGSHSLRKTFGYFHRTQLGTDIPTLMRLFNHSTQRQTLDYLCIQADEIKSAYMKEI